jgi:Glycosyl hydrolase family 65 central catalytic domain
MRAAQTTSPASLLNTKMPGGEEGGIRPSDRGVIPPPKGRCALPFIICPVQQTRQTTASQSAPAGWWDLLTKGMCSGTQTFSCCPFFILAYPDAARALVTYRYHTLAGAHAKAAAWLGYRGALYAWESTDSGDEVMPPFVIDRARSCASSRESRSST